MESKLILIVSYVVLFLYTKSTAQASPQKNIIRGDCSKLKDFTESNETEASIELTWVIPPECRRIINGYNLTFGTIGGSLESEFIEVKKNLTLMNHTLENLMPGREYLIIITVNYNNNSVTIKRPKCIMSGRASNITGSSPTSASPPKITMPTTATMPTKSTSVNGGGIAGIVVAFVFVVVIVIIVLISVWLIYRRRKQRSRDGLHYISIVQGIGNESKRGQLYSRPGYLQIIAPCAGYEIPCNSVNITPELALTNETEYPRRELGGCTDSNSSINSVQVTTQLIQTSLVSASVTDRYANNLQVPTGQTKLVKPYAIVDVKDISTNKGLQVSQGLLDRLKARRQKQEKLPSNREALTNSFASCPNNSITQFEQRSSTGRYYTVPIYVNLNIPMTVNPSYNKNKV